MLKNLDRARIIVAVKVEHAQIVVGGSKVRSELDHSPILLDRCRDVSACRAALACAYRFCTSGVTSSVACAALAYDAARASSHNSSKHWVNLYENAKRPILMASDYSGLKDP